MKNITNEDIDAMVVCYVECETEEDRQEVVYNLAVEFKIRTMDVRQLLTEEKVYGKRFSEELTEKEQYAKALQAVTEIPAKEFEKMTIKACKKLFKVFSSK